MVRQDSMRRRRVWRFSSSSAAPSVVTFFEACHRSTRLHNRECKQENKKDGANTRTVVPQDPNLQLTTFLRTPHAKSLDLTPHLHSPHLRVQAVLRS